MINSPTYRFLFIIALTMMLSSGVKSQQCEMNMLFIEDSTGFGYVPKFSGTKLGNTFTIEFWVQSLQSQKGKGIIEIGKTGDAGTIRFEIDSSSFIRSTTNLTGSSPSLSAGPIFSMDWNHVALTLSTKDTLKLYLNGVLAASQKVPNRNLRISGDTLFIGKSSFLGTGLYGNIDELRIWNRERTQAQIAGSKDKTISDTAAGLIAYYRLDDRPDFGLIHDFTGKGNDGSITGNAVTTATTSPVKETKHPGYMLDALEKVVDMGIISCGGSKQSLIHITNKGLDTLGIKSIGFIKQNSIFSINTTPPFPLYPGRTGIISIQADANGVGIFTDTLEIASSTECGGTVRVLIKIRVDSAGIAFRDSIVKIAKIVDCNLPQNTSVELVNTGLTKVTIIETKVFGDQNIEYLSPAPPFTIDSGRSISIQVRIKNGVEGVFNATLQAKTKECGRVAQTVITGERTRVRFELPPEIYFPDEYTKAGATTHDTTFSIINRGSSDIFFDFRPDSNFMGFQIVSPASGKAYLNPGDTAKIIVRFQPPTCGDFTGKIRITGTPCNIDTVFRVHAKLKGPFIEAPQTVDIGATCSSYDTTITLINRSEVISIINKPAFDTQNIFTYVDNGILPKQLSPGDSVKVTIRFAPNTPGAHTVLASFPQNPCGSVAINLKGYLGVGLIAISDSLMDFGLACDLSPQQKKIAITNNAGKNVTVTTADINGSPDYILISPKPPFSLSNGETKEITIEYDPQSLGIDSAKLFMTDNGCFVSSIPIAGIREITSLALSSDSLFFDEICPGKRQVKNIDIINKGGGTVSISSASFNTSIFGVGNLSGVKIGAGKTGTVPVSFNPTALIDYSDVLTIVIAPCNDTLRLVLRGEGGPITDIVLQDTALDFGVVKVGDSAIRCLRITNPSCIPVMINGIDITIDGSTALDLTDSSLSVLPLIVSRDEPQELCFKYKPTSEGSDERTCIISANGKTFSTRLHGTSIAPHIVHSTKILDFGDVLLDSTKAQTDTISNIGKLPVVFTNDITVDPVFTVNTIPSALGSGDDSLLTVTFTPNATFFYIDTLFMAWENTIDTIILRGRGTGHGALVSSTGIDFGDVRVGTSQSDVIAVTGGDGFPITLSNITITGDVNTSFTFLQPKKTVLSSTLDTSFIIVTYAPTPEVAESAQLVFDDNSGNKKSVNLKGRGVEAHLHIDMPLVDFGIVKVGAEKLAKLPVMNTGNFPLAISEARPSLREVFDLKKLPQGVIPAQGREDFEYSFTPTSDNVFYDTVTVIADAPEKERTVILRGEGTYGDIVYTVGDVTLNVGDIIDVPVSISGIDLATSTIDSFSCTLRYDPTVMFVHSVVTDNTLSSGMYITIEKQPKDSIVRVTGFGKHLPNTPGVLFYLHSEALLGPVDTTGVRVEASSPKHASPQAAQGLFTVADCGKYRTNIHYKGPYSVSAPKPNPVTTTLSLTYELGLEGFVSLDIYDELGVLKKHVLAENKEKGKHAITINVEDLPSGMYTYLLQSLEYKEAKSFIISK